MPPRLLDEEQQQEEIDEDPRRVSAFSCRYTGLREAGPPCTDQMLDSSRNIALSSVDPVITTLDTPSAADRHRIYILSAVVRLLERRNQV